MDKDQNATDLHYLNIEYREIETAIRAKVDQAREAGTSWTVIGEALGITKQTAHARYGKVASKPAPKPHSTEATDRAALRKIASKISDTDVAGTSETPSIFSDAAAPAKRTKRPNFLIPDPDKTAQPGTGKGPHQCPACGDTNHKTAQYGLAAFTPTCKPTKYDPPKIVELIKEKNA